MPSDLLVQLAAAAALLGLMLYVVLAGADFGGGVWDLLARGPRGQEQRDAIAEAMGPVWEANHVWLIFVLVTLFTCFPYGYRALSETLFLPFHLALVGMMLRGAAFVFRAYGEQYIDPAGRQRRHAPTWQAVFGAASVISPFLLGACFGVITAGDVRVDRSGAVHLAHHTPWLQPYPIGCGLLALAACAYLAAVYLTAETAGSLRADFRRRAILAGTTTAALAGIVLFLAWHQATWFFHQLFAPRSIPVITAGLVLFVLSAWAVFGHRYRVSRVFAAGEIVLLLLGWGIAHRPYLLYPDMTLDRAAAPAVTIRFVLWSLPVGVALLGPSLYLLFRVFKPRHVTSAT